MVNVAINSNVVDNKCYISTEMKNACYLSYLTLELTVSKTIETDKKLVRIAAYSL